MRTGNIKIVGGVFDTKLELEHAGVAAGFPSHADVYRQETNGEQNKSLSKLTVQNTQAAKDLNEAREKQRQLERQLQEAVEGKSNVWTWVAIVAIIGVLFFFLHDK